MEQLPKFDDLMALADADPEAFDNLRQRACQQYIQTVPRAHRHKLRAVQHRVEVTLQRAKSPMAGVIQLSGMMHDSLHQLSTKLDLINPHHPDPAAEDDAPGGELIQFQEWKNKHH
ncbi:DUF3135 domain-containing protein [Motiliproteus coralliicola]|uniref:DUF3135 domain-containing protein n=1 Tax=Motiliproteus coralliicola TaxID=2283196 RepID=A0A369WNY4_9GAMM|nr:DUF3135 domain-containing protein [Motiliproteus coralliicola]RDE22779.1 DUF3135 domain-containing protein [Motiliproteus coralliicola]